MQQGCSLPLATCRLLLAVKDNKIIFTRGQFTRLRPDGSLGESVYYIAIDQMTIKKAHGCVDMSYGPAPLERIHLRELLIANAANGNIHVAVIVAFRPRCCVVPVVEQETE